MRFRLHHLAILGGGVATFFACIPDPHGDYEDFKEKTASLTPPVETPDAAPIDAKPPEQAVEQLYVAVCVTSLANRDPEQAFRFYTESKYVPDGAGAATGKLTLKLTTLKGWDKAKNQYVVPATVNPAEKRGDPINVPDLAVSASGRFTAPLGTIKLAEEANPISGREAVLEGVVLDGLFGVDNFCSTFGGTLTVPYVFELEASKNTCLFTKVKDNDPFPKLDAKNFVCPF